MLRSLIALLLSVVLMNGAVACTIPYEASGWGKAELVARTPTIVLAALARSEPAGEQRRFEFRILEVLKGSLSKQFSLELEPAPSTYVETTFRSHEDPKFWNDNTGRLPWLAGPCTPHYAFVVGGHYLVFIESLANGASAERISHRKDRWYRYVVRHTKSKL